MCCVHVSVCTHCCVHCCRLGWPDLLDHPFVRETDTERLIREKALADAMELADSSRGWKVRAEWIGSAMHAEQFRGHASAYLHLGSWAGFFRVL